MLVVGCWGSRRADALDPAQSLDRYNKVAWSTESGLPQNSVHTILQTSDGFLWLGTEAGLARFDGYQFRVFDGESTPALAGDDIRCLLQDHTGALWVGTGSGLTRLKDGSAQSFSLREAAAMGAVRALVQTENGSLWALAAGGLAVANVAEDGKGGIRFQMLSERDGLPNADVLSIAKDGRDGIWIGTAEGLYHATGTHVQPGPVALTHTAIEVLATDASGGSLLVGSRDGLARLEGRAVTWLAQREQLPSGGVRSLVETPEGVWVLGRNSVTLVRRTGNVAYAAGKELPGTQLSTMVSDRHGVVWIGTNAGLARIWKGRVEAMKGADGSDSAAVLSIAEDREGDLWIGTETGGLRVLRERTFQPLFGSPKTFEEPTTSVLQAPDGAVWVGTNGAGVARIQGDKTRSFTTRDGLTSDTVLALGASSSSGAIWVGTPDGLNSLHGERWRALTSADGLADDLVRSVLVAHDGAVWVGSRRGVTVWHEGRSNILTKAQGLGSDLVGPLLETVDGDLWIGTSGGLSRFHAGALRTYTVADGLPGNTITTLAASAGGGLWVGTAGQGLARLNGSIFTSYSGSNALPRDIYSLLEDGHGSLWLTSDRGVFRVSVASLEAHRMNPRTEIAVVPFGSADGLPPVAGAGAGYPSAWRLRDGRLCFATQRGIVVADPSLFSLSEPPPPVALEEITADGRSVTRAEIASMPAETSRLSFSYAAINLAAPQRVQYRYMLQGLDRTWVDAGTRRIAYYTNLRHGHYVFRVAARNAGELWSPEADLPLEIRPHAFETIWFRVLAALLLLLLALGLYRMRVRTLQGRFNAVSAERNRLAREIHDTLAQSFVAVSMRLELMSQMLKTERGVDACRDQLDQTRSLVRDSLAEARRSIWDLRSEGAEARSLPARLGRLAQDARAEVGDAQLQTTGTYRTLPQATEDELFRIAQESVANVIRHARAESLRLRLSYEVESVSLVIEDDGQGFDVGQVPSSAEGHFGLTGIQERARLLGAQVMLESNLGRGSKVQLRVPLPHEDRLRGERS